MNKNRLFPDFRPISDELMKKHKGKQFVILRELSTEEVDREDCGRMYKIKLSCGTIVDAFEDELLTPNPKEQ